MLPESSNIENLASLEVGACIIPIGRDNRDLPLVTIPYTQCPGEFLRVCPYA